MKNLGLNGEPGVALAAGRNPASECAVYRRGGATTQLGDPRTAQDDPSGQEWMVEGTEDGERRV